MIDKEKLEKLVNELYAACEKLDELEPITETLADELDELGHNLPQDWHDYEYSSPIGFEERLFNLLPNHHFICANGKWIHVGYR